MRPEQVVESRVRRGPAFHPISRRSGPRFARVVRYRDDKPAAEADTIDAVRALYALTAVVWSKP